MGEYYTLGALGLVKTIAIAKNCETRKNMVMFATVNDGGFMGETLLLNEEDFVYAIEPK